MLHGPKGAACAAFICALVAGTTSPNAEDIGKTDIRLTTVAALTDKVQQKVTQQAVNGPLNALAWSYSPSGVHADQRPLRDLVVPVVMIGKESRMTLAAYAKRKKSRKASRRYAATGILKCGSSTGTAQLTMSNRVITTAAHVIFSRGGKPRVNLDKCIFKVKTGSGWASYPIDSQSIQCGTRSPYGTSATKDWAVMRLKKPVRNVRPYAIGSARVGSTIQLLASTHHNWSKKGKTIEACKIRQTGRAAGGLRELMFDCDAGHGASGSALLRGRSMVALYVGYRSRNPGKAQPYSKSHYNFAVSIDGPLKRAIMSLAR